MAERVAGFMVVPDLNLVFFETLVYIEETEVNRTRLIQTPIASIECMTYLTDEFPAHGPYK